MDVLRSPDAAAALVDGLLIAFAAAPPARVAAALAALPPTTREAGIHAIVASAVPGRDADRARAWEVVTEVCNAVPEGRTQVALRLNAIVPRFAGQGALLAVALPPSRVLQHCRSAIDLVLSGPYFVGVGTALGENPEVFVGGAEARALEELLGILAPRIQGRGGAALLDPAARLFEGVAHASARRVRTTAEWFAAKAEAAVRADTFTAGVRAVLEVRKRETGSAVAGSAADPPLTLTPSPQILCAPAAISYGTAVYTAPAELISAVGAVALRLRQGDAGALVDSVLLGTPDNRALQTFCSAVNEAGVVLTRRLPPAAAKMVDGAVAALPAPASVFDAVLAALAGTVYRPGVPSRTAEDALGFVFAALDAVQHTTAPPSRFICDIVCTALDDILRLARLDRFRVPEAIGALPPRLARMRAVPQFVVRSDALGTLLRGAYTALAKGDGLTLAELQALSARLRSGGFAGGWTAFVNTFHVWFGGAGPGKPLTPGWLDELSQAFAAERAVMHGANRAVAFLREHRLDMPAIDVWSEAMIPGKTLREMRLHNADLKQALALRDRSFAALSRLSGNAMFERVFVRLLEGQSQQQSIDALVEATLASVAGLRLPRDARLSQFMAAVGGGVDVRDLIAGRNANVATDLAALRAFFDDQQADVGGEGVGGGNADIALLQAVEPLVNYAKVLEPLRLALQTLRVGTAVELERLVAASASLSEDPPLAKGAAILGAVRAALFDLSPEVCRLLVSLSTANNVVHFLREVRRLAEVAARRGGRGASAAAVRGTGDVAVQNAVLRAQNRAAANPHHLETLQRLNSLIELAAPLFAGRAGTVPAAAAGIGGVAGAAAANIVTAAISANEALPVDDSVPLLHVAVHILQLLRRRAGGTAAAGAVLEQQQERRIDTAARELTREVSDVQRDWGGVAQYFEDGGGVSQAEDDVRWRTRVPAMCATGTWLAMLCEDESSGAIVSRLLLEYDEPPEDCGTARRRTVLLPDDILLAVGYASWSASSTDVKEGARELIEAARTLLTSHRSAEACNRVRLRLQAAGHPDHQVPVDDHIADVGDAASRLDAAAATRTPHAPVGGNSCPPAPFRLGAIRSISDGLATLHQTEVEWIQGVAEESRTNPRLLLLGHTGLTRLVSLVLPLNAALRGGGGATVAARQAALERILPLLAQAFPVCASAELRTAVSNALTAAAPADSPLKLASTIVRSTSANLPPGFGGDADGNVGDAAGIDDAGEDSPQLTVVDVGTSNRGGTSSIDTALFNALVGALAAADCTRGMSPRQLLWASPGTTPAEVAEWLSVVRTRGLVQAAAVVGADRLLPQARQSLLEGLSAARLDCSTVLLFASRAGMEGFAHLVDRGGAGPTADVAAFRSLLHALRTPATATAPITDVVIVGGGQGTGKSAWVVRTAGTTHILRIPVHECFSPARVARLYADECAKPGVQSLALHFDVYDTTGGIGSGMLPAFNRFLFTLFSAGYFHDAATGAAKALAPALAHKVYVELPALAAHEACGAGGRLGLEARSAWPASDADAVVAHPQLAVLPALRFAATATQTLKLVTHPLQVTPELRHAAALLALLDRPGPIRPGDIPIVSPAAGADDAAAVARVVTAFVAAGVPRTAEALSLALRQFAATAADIIRIQAEVVRLQQAKLWRGVYVCAVAQPANGDAPFGGHHSPEFFKACLRIAVANAAAVSCAPLTPDKGVPWLIVPKQLVNELCVLVTGGACPATAGFPAELMFYARTPPPQDPGATLMAVEQAEARAVAEKQGMRNALARAFGFRNSQNMWQVLSKARFVMTPAFAGQLLSAWGTGTRRGRGGAKGASLASLLPPQPDAPLQWSRRGMPSARPL